MLGVADYGAFVVAILVFLAIPGPGNLALITSTGKGGIKGGHGNIDGPFDPIGMFMPLDLRAECPADHGAQHGGAKSRPLAGLERPRQGFAPPHGQLIIGLLHLK